MNLDQNVTMVIKHSAQGPLLLEDNNRRLRLLTTKEDIVLNLWIHIPFLSYHFAFFVFKLLSVRATAHNRCDA